ncbi:MAG: MarR family transcriptional regulator [Treponema sp.]|jgi:DNA-binding MarR family transcriptional regulator|nr:MarR family transcriptional regulator [Treponema sp.]
MAENQNLSHEAARRFTYLMNQIDELYHKVNAKSALSDSVSWILYCLFDMGGPCNQSEFTRLYGISRKTINSALSKLESLGLVKRTAGDGRNVIVSLTEQGLALAKKSVEPMIAAENSVFDTWTQAEKSQFFSLMEKYKSALEKQFKVQELI